MGEVHEAIGFVRIGHPDLKTYSYTALMIHSRSKPSSACFTKLSLDFNDQPDLDGALRLNLEIRTGPLRVAGEKYKEMFPPKGHPGFGSG